MTKKYIFLIFTALNLSACGSDSSPSSDTHQDNSSLTVSQSIQAKSILLEWNKIEGIKHYKLIRYRPSTQGLTSEVVEPSITGTSYNLKIDLVDFDATSSDYELLACKDNDYCLVQSPQFQLKNLEQTVIRVKTYLDHSEWNNVRFGEALTWQNDHLIINSGKDTTRVVDIYTKQKSGNYGYDEYIANSTSYNTDGQKTTNSLVGIGNTLEDMMLATSTCSTKKEALIHINKMHHDNNGRPKLSLKNYSDSSGQALASSGENGGIIIMGDPEKNDAGEVSFFINKDLNFPAAPESGIKTLRHPSELKLKRPDDLAVDTRFGASVAIAKDNVLVVGAPMDSMRKGTGSEVQHGGAVYVYRLNPSPNEYNDIWHLETVLELPIPTENSGYGSSVTISKDANLILVGAPGIDKVLSYRYDSQKGFWSNVDSIDPVKAFKGQKFGSDIALSDNGYLAVSAPQAPWRGFGFHHSPDTLEIGGDSDGAVYVYHLTSYGDRDYAWEGVFTGDSISGVNEEFGKSMMFKPGTDELAIGAPGHPSDPLLGWSDNSWKDAGAVYIF
ncbi:hypothetical protein OW495_07920 [Vibrio sp. 14N.309.X.WAT.E.F5]|uniref:hypothetical protein n=1 Tax=Vibrio TaxID=662 RepID=UPI000C8224DF|nr:MULTISPECIES: hypothetical protein [Vibrio]MDN2666638.1 hypothetical protein [Vibrio sp. 14N.309.X.WAT.E.F5]PMJ85244.1 hypothetical protein BCU13_14915 [Vibrio lentus]